MCRMLGVVSTYPTSVRELLHDGPRSLRALSEEHCDGWGIALRSQHDWTVHRSIHCAARCALYSSLDVAATQVIAHVRKKTVGDLAVVNTHPFRRGDFVFAHNGTVENVAAIEARIAPEHRAAIEGTTDSERLFAFVLTYIDDAGNDARGIVAATRALHAIDNIGTVNFLISCGARLYAHRLGRELFTLTRDGVSFVASEPLTDGEPWREVGERQLIVLDAQAAPSIAA